MRVFNYLALALSTFFFAGYLPFPGTSASLAGILLFFLVKDNILLYLLLTLIFILLGLSITGRSERILGRKDPPCVVIDEVVGMFISLIFLPYNLRLVILAFILFRILDIFKPYPISKLQKVAGGAGIMGDDIIAGLYTNIILQLVLRFSSFKAS